MSASLALTALAVEPCSRAVSIFFPELKRPLLRSAVAENVSCCCGMDTAGGMDTWMDGFRHERAWLQRSSRHAVTAPRCAPAPEPHVCSLCRCSVDSQELAACCAPTTSTRPAGSSAGAAGRSKWRLPLLWLALLSPWYRHVPLEHTGNAKYTARRSGCGVPVTSPAIWPLYPPLAGFGSS